MQLKTYILRLSLCLLLMQTCLQAAADAVLDARIDSVLKTIKSYPPDEREEVWKQLFNMALATGEMYRQQRCLDDWIADAHRHGNYESEGIARRYKIVNYFNNAHYDSVYAIVPGAIEFFKGHDLNRRAYEVWHLMGNAYRLQGKYSTAMNEMQKMHADASAAKDSYGQALAFFDMGNIYNALGLSEKACEMFGQSANLLKGVKDANSTILELYAYYSEALASAKRYDELEKVTEDWKKYIDERRKKSEDETDDLRYILANYYVTRAQALLGKGKLDEADEALDEAERRLADDHDSYEWAFLLSSRAQVAMEKGQHERALELNTERMRLFEQMDDRPSLLATKLQRAEILMRTGLYKESAEEYKAAYEQNDSLNTSAFRAQLNEMNAIFQIEELNRKSAEVKNHYMMIVGGVVLLTFLFYSILRYRTRKKLQRKNAELKRNNEELMIANERAKESSLAKTVFVRNVSHEIRTPLNILSGFTEVLAEQGPYMSEEERKEVARQIEDNTERITELVNKILELADTSASTVIERKDTVTVSQLVKDLTNVSGILKKTAPANADSKVRFIVETGEVADVKLTTNSVYVVRALRQLLENGLKFTKEGHVKLRVEKQDFLLAFIVEDTGIGISPEDAERIFGEFVQLNEHTDGTGIGLVVARSIARRLGGEVMLDPSYTEGARFVMTLPV